MTKAPRINPKGSNQIGIWSDTSSESREVEVVVGSLAPDVNAEMSDTVVGAARVCVASLMKRMQMSMI